MKTIQISIKNKILCIKNKMTKKQQNLKIQYHKQITVLSISLFRKANRKFHNFFLQFYECEIMANKY